MIWNWDLVFSQSHICYRFTDHRAPLRAAAMMCYSRGGRRRTGPMMLRTRRAVCTLAALATAGLVAGLAAGQSIQRDSFDGAEVQGARGAAESNSAIALRAP